MAPDRPPAQDVRQQEPENHGCETLNNWIHLPQQETCFVQHHLAAGI